MRLVGGRCDDEGENLDRIARAWIWNGVDIDACGSIFFASEEIGLALANACIDILAQVEHLEMEIGNGVATTSRCAMIPDLVGIGFDARDVAPHVDVATTDGVVGVAHGNRVDSELEMLDGVALSRCDKHVEMVDTDEELVGRDRESVTKIVLTLAERDAMGDLASIACDTDIVDGNDVALGCGTRVDRETELDGVASKGLKVESGLLPTRVASLEDDLRELTSGSTTDFDFEGGIVGEIAIAI